MLTLEITQGEDKAFVLQVKNPDQSLPNQFLPTDALTAFVWVGQNQQVLFSPAASWFTGIMELTLDSPGAGYTQPVCAIVGGGGTGATAQAIFDPVSGEITQILLTNYGTGYTSTPAVTITDPTGGGAVIVATPALGSLFGRVLLTITQAQSATLDFAGIYHVQVYSARDGTKACVGDCRLQVSPAPGAFTQTGLTYCSYRDVLRYAPWITMLQDDEAETEGYYEERREATEWLQDLIVRNWRGSTYAAFGDPGRSMNQWMGGWTQRSSLPDQWLMNQLSGGVVQQQPTVTAPGSGYTFATVTFSGGGVPVVVPPVQSPQATATATISNGQIISIYLNYAGYGYLSTPTITITGNGTGATATCTITRSTLLLRRKVIRLVAKKAASIVGLAQIARNNQVASYGARFRDEASVEVQNMVAELDLNGDGIADFPVPLGLTNTLFG